MKLFLPIAFSFFFCFTQGTAMVFSLKELEVLKGFSMQSPSFIKASDTTGLAYYSFIPENPKAIVIFYHGAGFYSTALYQYFAQQLSEVHGIGCYLFDIRGHGHSEGPRGDAPSIQHVFDDITKAVDFAGEQHRNLPIFLAGHSAGGGLVLNYGSQHPSVKGSLLIAPYLGRNSEAHKTHSDPARAFVKKVAVWKFILNGISNGYLFGHSPAVFFNYSEKLIANYPLIVSNYTVTMMSASSPEAPRSQLSNLTAPVALFAAKNDELFDAELLMAYKSSFPVSHKETSVAEIMPATTHLNCMVHAAGYCASFIEKLI